MKSEHILIVAYPAIKSLIYPQSPLTVWDVIDKVDPKWDSLSQDGRIKKICDMLRRELGGKNGTEDSI